MTTWGFKHDTLVTLLLVLRVVLADLASGIDRESQQPEHDSVFEVDEECAAVQGDESDGDCALSLRQLRKLGTSSGAALDPVEDVEAEDVEVEDVDAEDDGDLGIPGGWGEAAGFAEEVAHDEQLLPNVTESDVHANYIWGSCRQYRCVSYYFRSHGCQCNPGCSLHGSCCRDYWSRCHYNSRRPPPVRSAPVYGGRVLTLYHQTSAYAGRLILQNGFRAGSSGWCGGGIYFAMTPEATYTKAIGPQSHQGFMIEAQVNVGRVKYLSSKCDRSLNGRRVSMQRFDSVSFDPGDGREYVVYSKDRILSTRAHSL